MLLKTNEMFDVVFFWIILIASAFCTFLKKNLRLSHTFYLIRICAKDIHLQFYIDLYKKCHVKYSEQCECNFQCEPHVILGSHHVTFKVVSDILYQIFLWQINKSLLLINVLKNAVLWCPRSVNSEAFIHTRHCKWVFPI